MKKFLTVVAGLIFLGLLVQSATSVQQSKTGDRRLNTLLGKIDARAEAEPDVFFQQLSQRHDIPEQEIRQAKERHGLGYGDIYMATALSRISKKPVGTVAEDFQQEPGPGLGRDGHEPGHQARFPGVQADEGQRPRLGGPHEDRVQG